MRKAYLLVYSTTLGTQEEVIACLNTIPGLKWRSDIANSFYLISEKSPQELVEAIRKCRSTAKNPRFLITEVGSNKYGWLTPDSWYFMEHLAHKPKTK